MTEVGEINGNQKEKKKITQRQAKKNLKELEERAQERRQRQKMIKDKFTTSYLQIYLN